MGRESLIFGSTPKFECGGFQQISTSPPHNSLASGSEDDMEIYDVVTKLVGEIDQVGETNEDDRRFKNLRVMTDLVEDLIDDLIKVASRKDRREYSINRAGKFAHNFLEDLGIEE